METAALSAVMPSGRTTPALSVTISSDFAPDF